MRRRLPSSASWSPWAYLDASSSAAWATSTEAEAHLHGHGYAGVGHLHLLTGHGIAARIRLRRYIRHRLRLSNSSTLRLQRGTLRTEKIRNHQRPPRPLQDDWKRGGTHLRRLHLRRTPGLQARIPSLYGTGPSFGGYVYLR